MYFNVKKLSPKSVVNINKESDSVVKCGNVYLGCGIY